MVNLFQGGNFVNKDGKLIVYNYESCQIARKCHRQTISWSLRKLKQNLTHFVSIKVISKFQILCQWSQGKNLLILLFRIQSQRNRSKKPSVTMMFF